MPMTLAYTNFGSELVSESRGGTERDYLPDTLGSTAALLDSTQTMTDGWQYWPYGEVANRTGASSTPFNFVGAFGYFKDESPLIYVRARYYEPGYAQFITPAQLLDQTRGEHPYAYAFESPVAYFDADGTFPQKAGLTWVEICRRQLQPGDYASGGVYYGTLGIPEHWWIQTSSRNPKCQSIGYGPGGILHHPGNLGAGSPSQIRCERVNATPAQAACLCGAVGPLQGGNLMCGTTWCDTGKSGDHHDYNFVSHNCQNFAENLLSKCGMSPPWTRQNDPLYWLPGMVGF